MNMFKACVELNDIEVIYTHILPYIIIFLHCNTVTMEDQRKLCLSRLMYTLLIASLIISVNLLWIYPTLIYEIQRDIYMKNVEYLYFNVKDIMILNIKDTLGKSFVLDDVLIFFKLRPLHSLGCSILPFKTVALFHIN